MLRFFLQVEALLAEACTATTPVISAAAPAVVIKVVHAIRECPAAVIQTIASKYVLTAAAAADDCAIKKRYDRASTSTIVVFTAGPFICGQIPYYDMTIL